MPRKKIAQQVFYPTPMDVNPVPPRFRSATAEPRPKRGRPKAQHQPPVRPHSAQQLHAIDPALLSSPMAGPSNYRSPSPLRTPAPGAMETLAPEVVCPTPTRGSPAPVLTYEPEPEPAPGPSAKALGKRRAQPPSPLLALPTIEEACWLDELFGSPVLTESWTDDPPERSAPVLFHVPSPSPPPLQQPQPTVAPCQLPNGHFVFQPTQPTVYLPEAPSPSPSPASAWLPPFAFPHMFEPHMAPGQRTLTYRMPNGRMDYFVWGDPAGVAQLTMTASVADMQEHHARLYWQQHPPPRFRQ